MTEQAQFFEATGQSDSLAHTAIHGDAQQALNISSKIMEICSNWNTRMGISQWSSDCSTDIIGSCNARSPSDFTRIFSLRLDCQPLNIQQNFSIDMNNSPGVADSNRLYLPGVPAPRVPKAAWPLPVTFREGPDGAAGQLRGRVSLLQLCIIMGATPVLERALARGLLALHELRQTQQQAALLCALLSEGVHCLGWVMQHLPSHLVFIPCSFFLPMHCAPGALSQLLPLHIAALLGDADKVRWLLSNTRVQAHAWTMLRGSGVTALHLAALAGSVDVCRVLVDEMKVCDMCVCGASQQNVLHQLAAIHPLDWTPAHDDVMDWLASSPESDALARGLDRWKCSPARVALAVGNSAVYTKLIDLGTSRSLHQTESSVSSFDAHSVTGLVDEAPGSLFAVSGSGAVESDLQLELLPSSARGHRSSASSGRSMSSGTLSPGVLARQTSRHSSSLPHTTKLLLASKDGAEMLDIHFWRQGISAECIVAGDHAHGQVLAACRLCCQHGDLAALQVCSALLPTQTCEPFSSQSAELFVKSSTFQTALIFGHMACIEHVWELPHLAWETHPIEARGAANPGAVVVGRDQLLKTHATTTSRDTAIVGEYKSTTARCVVQALQLGSHSAAAWVATTFASSTQLARDTMHEEEHHRKGATICRDISSAEVSAWTLDLLSAGFKCAASRGDVCALMALWKVLHSHSSLQSTTPEHHSSASAGVTLRTAAALHDALTFSLEASHWAAAAWLTEVAGVDCSAALPISGRQNPGNVLHWACRLDHDDAVEWLLQQPCREAMLAANDSRGMSPLMIACRSNHESIVRKLVQAGGSIEHHGGRQGMNVLHFVAASGNASLLHLLLPAGHNADLRNAVQQTPLHLACRKGHLDAAMLLVDVYAADVNAVDATGASPLLLACASGSIATVKWLFSLHNTSLVHVDHLQRGVLSYTARSVTQAAVRLVMWLLRRARTFASDARTHQIPLHWQEQAAPPQRDSENIIRVFRHLSDTMADCDLGSPSLGTCEHVGSGHYGNVLCGMQYRTRHLPSLTSFPSRRRRAGSIDFQDTGVDTPLSPTPADTVHSTRQPARGRRVAVKLFKAVLVESSPAAELPQMDASPGGCVLHSKYVSFVPAPDSAGELAAVPGAPPWLLAYLEMAPVFAIPRHPHVLPALQLLYEPLALVTPFCTNGSLEALLVSDQHPTQRAAKVSMNQRLQWAAQAASGIEELHAHGIIHRDVATRNLLLDSAWEVQVADFGLSRLLGTGGMAAPSPAIGQVQRSSSGHVHMLGNQTLTDGYLLALQALFVPPAPLDTVDGLPVLLPAPAPRARAAGAPAAAVGTASSSDGAASGAGASQPQPHRAYATTTAGAVPVAWTAPECFARRQFGPPSDIYALGVTLWEMLMGQSPWQLELQREGPLAVAQGVVRGRRLPLPKQRIPPPIRSILRQCWAQDPSKRPSARQVRQFLQRQAALAPQEET